MGGKIYIDAKISFVPVLLEISASNTIDIYRLEFTLLICYKFKYKRYTLRIRLYTFRHTYEKLRNDTRHKEPYFSTREFISWQLRLVNIQKSGPKDFANGGTLKCTKQSITRNINYWHEKKKSLGTPLSCRL